MHIYTFIYTMHRVTSGLKYFGRNQSFNSHLQEDSHSLLTKSAPGSVYTWAPEQGSLRYVTVLGIARCGQPGWGDEGKGSWREALGKGNHPPCSAG